MHLLTRTIIVLALFVLALPPQEASARQTPLPLPIDIPGLTGFIESVPKPEAVMGTQIGTRHIRPDEIVDYFREVAQASDRVVYGEHGRTYEGRRLVHAIVTSPANHARLEEIRLANLRLSDEPGSMSDAALATMPTIVYMGYSVHGNEASGSDAGVLLLHHLAAGRGPAVESVLENTVIIIDPSINPDGRNRFVTWVTSNRGRVATTDPYDREHNEPWPNGRTNHYFFDLNRDWLPAQHPSSQGRLRLFHSWRPQLHTDFHEMGGNSTYFFQPGIPARDNPNTPQGTIDLTGEVAEFHARNLDRLGQLYYARESFDDFYYGKGSTYPDVNGAVGILFEQASSRGLLAETTFGELSYAATVRTQFATSLSTVEAAVTLRERLLRNHRDHYRGAPAFAAASPVKAWVIDLATDRSRSQSLARMLQRHRIELYDLAGSFQADGHVFRPGEAFIVPLDQPQARLINSMMERMTVFQDSLFYDVSTWTTPLAFGLKHAEVTRNPGSLLGTRLGEVRLDGGEVVGGRSSYAYIMEWNRYFAPRALHALQEAGVQTLVAFEPFALPVNGTVKRFDRGSIIIPVTSRDERSTLSADAVHELVERLAREDHVLFNAVSTGLTTEGINLGSPNSNILAKPSVALFSGSGTNSSMVGETWHLMNERMGIPVSLLDVADADRANLDRYNTIIMAGYSSGLSAGAQDRLERWVRSGGLLITLGNSVTWAIRRGLIDHEILSADRENERVAYADASARAGAQRIGGSIFEVDLDATHPIGFGAGPRIPVFRNHNIFVAPSSAPTGNVGVYTADPLLSGYIAAPQLDNIRETVAIAAHRAGSGRVVSFVDNPNFRAFWYGTNVLFLNAVFFGNSF